MRYGPERKNFYTEPVDETGKMERTWSLARRGIGDFTENGGPARARGGGKVRRTLMEGLIRENGEGVGFLAGFGDAEEGRGNNFDWRINLADLGPSGSAKAGTGVPCPCNARREGGLNLGEEEWVAGAAAGDDELVDFYFRQDEAVQGVDDRERGEDCGRANQVVGLGVVFAAEAQKLFDVGAAVIFASSGFGRCELQVRVTHQFVKKRRDAAALLREARVFVKALTAVSEMGNQRVDEHVRWTSIESEHLRWFGGSGNYGDVGDATEVERDAAEFGVAVEEIVDVRDEWRALAAERYVCGTKITNGGDIGARGDDGGFTDLQRGSSASAEIRNRLALMKDGLAVRADQRDSAR